MHACVCKPCKRHKKGCLFESKLPDTVEALLEPRREMVEGPRLTTPGSGRSAPNTRATREESIAEINGRTESREKRTSHGTDQWHDTKLPKETSHEQ